MKDTINNNIDTTLYNEKSLYLLNIRELRDIGRKFGVPSPTTKKKQDLIEYILKIVYGEIAPQRSNYGRPNVREFEMDKYVSKIKKNSDLTDELLKFKLDDYSLAGMLKLASPKESAVADNIETLVYIEENGKCYLRKHAFVSSKNDIEIDKNFATGLKLENLDVVEARVEADLFKIITINGVVQKDRFENFKVKTYTIKAGKKNSVDVQDFDEIERLKLQVKTECQTRGLKLVQFSSSTTQNDYGEIVLYNREDSSSKTYKNFMKFMGVCEKQVYSGEYVVILIEDARVTDSLFDDFDEAVGERAQNNINNSLKKFLALGNALISFRRVEEMEY